MAYNLRESVNPELFVCVCVRACVHVGGGVHAGGHV
jgi:hypothetical protein